MLPVTDVPTSANTSGMSDLRSTAIACLRIGSIFTSIVTNDMSDIRRVRRQQGEADCQLSDALQEMLGNIVALIITYTFLGVPYFIIVSWAPKPYSNY